MPPNALSRSILAVVILVVLVAGVFGPLLRNQFVDWDDRSEIFQNPDLNPVTSSGLLWNWSHTRLSLYMPITYMAWGGIAAIAPRDAAGLLRPSTFHAFNIVLHGLCSTLVFLLILQLFERVEPAFIASLVFALHPLQTEAVAWASGMYTLLSTAFSLAALISYIAFATTYKKRRTICFALGTAFYACALLTKAASVSVPLAAAVIDLLVLRRPVWQIIRSLLLWVLMSIPVILVAKYFQDVSMLQAPPWWVRPIIALDAVGFYLHKIVLPIHLVPDYGRNPTWVAHHPLLILFSVATACIALFIAWFARRKVSSFTAGVCLLIAGILPYLGLTTFDFQYVSTVADRYAYFGMVGIAYMVAAGVCRSQSFGRIILLLTTIFAALIHSQIKHWKNTNALFSYTLDVNPSSLVSHNVFGYLAARENRPGDAEAHYLAALKIWPEDATIQFDLGNLYLKNHPDLAAQRYALALKYQPKFVLYRNNLAVALARTNHAAQAYDQWQQAIADDPDYIDPRNNLADLLMNLGRVDEARSEYKTVLQIDPQNAHANVALQNLNKR